MNFADNAVYWALVIVIAIFVLYALPFLISVWIRPLMLLWGYILGRRRHHAILSPQYPSQPASAASAGSGSTSTVSSGSPQTIVTDVLKNESAYLDEMQKGRTDAFEKRLKTIQDRLDAVTKKYENQRNEAKDNFVGRPFSECLSKLNKITAKDSLLLILMMAFLTVDTLIAQQVFTSLGLFPTDKYPILGKEISFTLVGGLFLTGVVTLFLDIAWDRKRLQSFLKDKKAGIILGLLTLTIFVVLRFVTVAFPPYAKPVIELLLVLGWALGVVVVWWLLGEILGDTHNWFDVVIALGTPILLILLIAFGTLFFLEKAIEFLIMTMTRTWLQLRTTRITRGAQNAEISYEATKRGFYRGLTM